MVGWWSLDDGHRVVAWWLDGGMVVGWWYSGWMVVWWLVVWWLDGGRNGGWMVVRWFWLVRRCLSILTSSYLAQTYCRSLFPHTFTLICLDIF